jgi:hypothetical protein
MSFLVLTKFVAALPSKLQIPLTKIVIFDQTTPFFANISGRIIDRINPAFYLKAVPEI